MGPATLLLLPLLSLGCSGNAEDSTAEPARMVVVSIFPVGDLVARLAGRGVEVEVVLPPGASPATFDVTPRQLRDLGNASLFIMIGGGLDEWIARLPEASDGNPRVVRLSEGVPLLARTEEDPSGEDPGVEESELAHDHGSGNPHIWLDPILVRDRLLPTLEEALENAFPAEAERIRERGALLADSLTTLDAEIRDGLRSVRGRAFIATHSAWTYFASRYGLEEVGVIHAHPGQEPSSRDLADLLGVARSRQVECLFTEPQLGEVAARALAAELALPTCMLDPLGGPDLEGRNGYFELLRFNARQLARGLGGHGL